MLLVKDPFLLAVNILFIFAENLRLKWRITTYQLELQNQLRFVIHHSSKYSLKVLILLCELSWPAGDHCFPVEWWSSWIRDDFKTETAATFLGLTFGLLLNLASRAVLAWGYMMFYKSN